MSGKTQPQTRALHRAWCLLPGWKFSFVYPLAETFARAMPRAQQSLGLVHISRCAENLIVLRYFCSNVRSGGPQEHAREESSKNHLTYGLSDIPKSLRNFHQKLPPRHYLSLYSVLSAFHLSFSRCSPLSQHPTWNGVQMLSREKERLLAWL